jgi:hypothetical protein
MILVGASAIVCFVIRELSRPIGHISECGLGRVVRIEFTVIDAETGSPVPHPKLALRTRGMRELQARTAADGRVLLAFQPGSYEQYYPIRGFMYKVPYSHVELAIDAPGFQSVRRNLSSFRWDASYPSGTDPPPIFVKLGRRLLKL